MAKKLGIDNDVAQKIGQAAGKSQVSLPIPLLG
jgi:hypothetical protein